MGFLDWLSELVFGNTARSDARMAIYESGTLTELEARWAGMNATIQSEPSVLASYTATKKVMVERATTKPDLLTQFVSGALDTWLAKVKSYETKDPEQAKANLSALTADVMKTMGATAAIDLTLGALPNGMGTASTGNTKQLLSWLGFGAVLAAVAHDPVKIGMLRPYQDSLEQFFRNRRPNDVALFQAYRTRELAPEKVEDLSKLDDAVMNRIEAKNDEIYDAEISKWGYSVDFARALSRSATRTLNFSQLVTLARAGIYDRGLAIYSLWGEGLDRVVMPAALTAIETMRDREMYAGFRSMIEPSYVDGLISEEDLRAYWTLSGVPEKVQAWVLPRLRSRRTKALSASTEGAVRKEKDLTVSQLQTAYQDNLIDRAKAKAAIISMGYDAGETDILLNIAELRRKTPSAEKRKRLPLGDYEKAYKNKLITMPAVLARMEGEYDARDIELEKQLLIIGKA